MIGRSFQKGPFSTKGCYLYYNEKDLRRYGHKIYYGTGGTDADKISKIDPESSKKRPPGFDCSEGLVLFHINLVQIRNSLDSNQFSLHQLNFSEFYCTIGT